MIPVLFFVSLIIFVLINVIPGDPARVLLGEEATPEALATLRHVLGTDRPLPVQYARWIGGMVEGNFGKSFKDNTPVLPTLLQKIPVTAELTARGALHRVADRDPGGHRGGVAPAHPHRLRRVRGGPHRSERSQLLARDHGDLPVRGASALAAGVGLGPAHRGRRPATSARW